MVFVDRLHSQLTPPPQFDQYDIESMRESSSDRMSEYKAMINNILFCDLFMVVTFLSTHKHAHTLA